MTRRLAALALALAAGCSHGTAPACQTDEDCATGQSCEPLAGVCIAFPTPLLPAPDAGSDAHDATAD